jgi:hypothetical protein
MSGPGICINMLEFTTKGNQGGGGPEAPLTLAAFHQTFLGEH